MIAKEYKGATVEIQSLRNDFIMNGYIHELNLEWLEVRDKENLLPILNYETYVKLTVRKPNSAVRTLVGQVYISNTDFVRIVNVANLSDFERRRFFRIDLSLSGKIIVSEDIRNRIELSPDSAANDIERSTVEIKQFELRANNPGVADYFSDGVRKNIADTGEDATKDSTKLVRVRNLSLCGASIETDLPLETGDTLNVVLALSKSGEEELPVVIRREIKDNGDAKLYGCEIMEISSRVEQLLCGFLFEQQRLQIRRSKG